MVVINLLEENPVNIAGVIFTAQPDKVEEVAAELGTFPGAEVHVTGENGNMVVTIEESLSKESFAMGKKAKEEKSNKISFKKKTKNKKDHGLIGIITSMSNVPGVISSSLVFHHNDGGLPQHQEEK